MTIIPLSENGLQTENWQWHLKNAVRDASELGRLLEVELDEVSSSFPLLVPRPFIERMARRDARDPLLLQVLTRNEEAHVVEGYVNDPLEETAVASKGLLRKYRSRVLLITTPACAVNCRYCFRRHFPYSEQRPGKAGWQERLQDIGNDPSIDEVILSGGDPLVLGDDQLSELLTGISAIEHITTVRIHTRLPVVIPNRVTPGLIETLSRQRTKVVVVLHINHANEIDDAVIQASAQLREAAVTLLNQSVLLRGINDSADALINLSKKLFTAGVIPYYLHLLDPVAGAAHFDVAQERAIDIMQSMTDNLPGYLVPKLVRELPGETAKRPVYS